VHVCVADYNRPDTLRAALVGVNRLLLVSSSEAGLRLAQHTNVIAAAKRAGVSRIVYTGILNADDTSNPLAGEHQDTERALREAGVPFITLRNGWYTENYTDRLTQYLEAGEIVGAAGHGRISAASRRDYAAAAVAALLQKEEGNRTYELGGAAFDLFELARTITNVTGKNVRYATYRSRTISMRSGDRVSARLQPISWPHSTLRSAAATSRPKAKTSSGCSGVLPRLSSTSSARRTGVAYRDTEAGVRGRPCPPAWPLHHLLARTRAVVSSSTGPGVDAMAHCPSAGALIRAPGRDCGPRGP
jgi:uncharacterized protein YbjT (DUF2867 family)